MTDLAWIGLTVGHIEHRGRGACNWKAPVVLNLMYDQKHPKRSYMCSVVRPCYLWFDVSSGSWSELLEVMGRLIPRGSNR